MAGPVTVRRPQSPDRRMAGMWPLDADSLAAEQRRLADLVPEPWAPPDRPLRVAGCWACFPRGIAGPGATGDRVWAAAVVCASGRVLDRVVVTGTAEAPYTPGVLALRIGPLLARVVGALSVDPDVLLLDATGRDHPRRAGLALHLGAELGLPSVGVTHRPLVAEGDWPAEERGALSPLRADDTVVAAWLRTRAGTRPLVVHPGWRVTLEQAARIVLDTTGVRRTPEPLRRARELAREARAGVPSR